MSMHLILFLISIIIVNDLSLNFDLHTKYAPYYTVGKIILSFIQIG